MESDWSSHWFVCQKCLQCFLGDRAFRRHKMTCRAGRTELLIRVESLGGKDAPTGTERRERSLDTPELSRGAFGSLTTDNEGEEKKKQFECEHCLRKFALNFHLKRHLLMHKLEVMTTVLQPTRMNSEMNKDESQVEKTLHRCRHCNESFVLLTSLQHHECGDQSEGSLDQIDFEQNPDENSDSGNENEPELVSETLPQDSLLKRRRLPRGRRSKVRKADGHFRCSYCPSVFKTYEYLRRHTRIHTGERPFECTICNKTFTQSSTLRVHQRLHTGGKSFKCSFCNKTFPHASTLRNHERIHTGEKPFLCTVCHKTFSHASYLRTHARLHTGEKPFQCTVCNKTFAQSSHLRYHERLHTGEKPFQCDVCNKSFSQSSSLIRHERLHTGEKPFQCTR